MFEFTIEKQKLITPLLTVSGAVDKKQSLPILSNILISAHEETLLLSATDLEIEITAHIPCSSTADNGKITVPARKFVEIIRAINDNSAPTISCDDKIVTIKEGRSKFKLTTLPAQGFPTTENAVNEIEFTIPTTGLLHLLQSTHFALSQQDVRIFLNGLLLELNGKSITSVAADGHRMSICRILCDSNNPDYRLLIPRKGVQEILRLLNNIEDTEVSVAAGKSHIKIETQHYTFLSKLIDTKYPSYSRAIPTKQDKAVVIDRDILKRSLSRSVILANEKSKAIMLNVQDDLLTIIANNQEQDESEEQLEAKTEGEPIQIGVNASYLLDVLNYLDEGDVRISLSNSESSILVESVRDDMYQYIIMPMKI